MILIVTHKPNQIIIRIRLIEHACFYNAQQDVSYASPFLRFEKESVFSVPLNQRKRQRSPAFKELR
jgi:hypothetical protein